jgi:hypothetical protein
MVIAELSKPLLRYARYIMTEAGDIEMWLPTERREQKDKTATLAVIGE